MGTENCLKDILLRCLGSSSVVSHNTACCSVCCTNVVPYARLDVLKPGTRQYHKRPTALREMPEALTNNFVALQQERDQMAEKPSYHILGPQYICSDSVIEVCSRAKYITSVDHLDITFLRPELRFRFHSAVMNTVADAPPSKRQRRK